MNAVFIDEDVFLSFLVREDNNQFGRARVLFERAEAGRGKLETNELVLYELVRVLESRYALTREAIVQVLEAILGTRNLRISGRRVLKQAVEIYASSEMTFIDAFNTAYADERGLKRKGDVMQEALA